MNYELRIVKSKVPGREEPVVGGKRQWRNTNHVRYSIGNGGVEAFDLAILLGAWSPCQPPYKISHEAKNSRADVPICHQL